MQHRTRLIAAALALSTVAVSSREVLAPSDITVPSLEEPIDLLAGGLDEWLFVSEAGHAERAGVASFEDGVLRLSGDPVGALTTRRWYRNYVLELEWRWPGEPGNSGLLVHAQSPLAWHGWPRCLEVQLRSGDAGDFILMGDHVGLRANDEPDPIAPATPDNPEIRRRVAGLVDGAERPTGEWNSMRVVCEEDAVLVVVNGMPLNAAAGSTIVEGALALQSEGSPIEFRKLRLEPLD
ncbi:MAG: DUF1080 domain-containing protein [Planctomycetota bacterium]